MNILRKMIIYGLVVIAICSIAWPIFLDFYFYANSPRSPDPLHGFTYPVIVQHGAKVYLNSEQWWWFSPISKGIYYSVFVLAGILGYKLEKRWKKNLLKGK